MTCASQRMLFGRTNANRPSRFLGEIPPEFVDQSGHGRRWSSGGEEGSAQSAGDGFRRRAPVKRTFDRGYSMGSAAAPAGSAAAPDWKSPGSASGGSWDFRKGDAVVHKAFGQGLITKLTPMGGDALAEIAFDTVGTKKLMLKSASQYMKKAGG